MSNPTIQYETPETLAAKVTKEVEPKMVINPLTLMEIVYEVITGYMAHPNNDPSEMGYRFTSRYNHDETKSDIHVALSYDWKATTASKVPAIFIQRGTSQLKHPTMGGIVSHAGHKDSEDERLVINEVPIIVTVIAKPFGVAEQIADWIKQGLVSYQLEIQRDFRLRRFKVVEVSAPKIYIEGKDEFAIMLSINAVFDEGWILKRDDLKLKAVGTAIFDKVTSKPLERI